jgi:O-antigen ligase
MSIQAVKLNFVPNWIPTLLGLGLGGVVAYFIVAERWPVVFGLLLAIPAFIFLQRYPFMAVMVWLILDPFLITAPSSAGRMVYWMIHRALPPLAVGVIVLNDYVLRLNQRRLPKMGLAELAMAGYVVASLVSIILLNDSPQATAYLFYDRVFSPMCLYLVVRLSTPNEQDMRRMIPIVFFVCVSQSAIGILSWFAPQALPSAWLTKAGARATGSLQSPSVYTSTLVFAGLLVFHSALNRKHDMVRLSYWGAFVLGFLGVFLSFSRASWLSGLMIITGLLFLYPRAMARLIVVGLIIALLGRGMFADQIHFAYERLSSEEAEESALSRLPVAYAGLRMFQTKPFFGWGYENFNRYDKQFQGVVANVAPDKDHSSHNVYLTILAEQGVIGLLLFLTPLIGWFVSSIRIIPQMPKQGFWSRNLLITFWLMILHQTVVNNFSNMRVVFGLGLWWVTLGLIANLVDCYRESDDPVFRTRPMELHLNGQLKINQLQRY